MNSPSIPNLLQADLVIDAELWERLEHVAKERDSDPRALASWILFQQLEHL